SFLFFPFLPFSLLFLPHPLLAVPAALIFSFLESGAQAAVLTTDFSFRLDAVIRGVVFLFITVSYARPGRRT
ncbi:MAG: hypothetical protein ACLFST_15775, partial [Spirochaetia bacterium]